MGAEHHQANFDITGDIISLFKFFSVAFRSIFFSEKRICDKIFHFQKTMLPFRLFFTRKKITTPQKLFGPHSRAWS
jgi:hypothetical protein